MKIPIEAKLLACFALGTILISFGYYVCLPTIKEKLSSNEDHFAFPEGYGLIKITLEDFLKINANLTERIYPKTNYEIKTKYFQMFDSLNQKTCTIENKSPIMSDLDAQALENFNEEKHFKEMNKKVIVHLAFKNIAEYNGIPAIYLFILRNAEEKYQIRAENCKRVFGACFFEFETLEILSFANLKIDCIKLFYLEENNSLHDQLKKKDTSAYIPKLCNFVFRNLQFFLGNHDLLASFSFEIDSNDETTQDIEIKKTKDFESEVMKALREGVIKKTREKECASLIILTSVVAKKLNES